MQISRLDKIIENNVTYSAQKANQEQVIYILQDISATLAMIYDRICGAKPVSDASESIVARIIPFKELDKKTPFYFEHIEYKGYDSSFLRFDSYEELDVIRNKRKIERFAVIDSFGHEMKLNEKDYEKTWRCWTMEPTDEERKKEKWKK